MDVGPQLACPGRTARAQQAVHRGASQRGPPVRRHQLSRERAERAEPAAAHGRAVFTTTLLRDPESRTHSLERLNATARGAGSPSSEAEPEQAQPSQTETGMVSSGRHARVTKPAQKQTAAPVHTGHKRSTSSSQAATFESVHEAQSVRLAQHEEQAYCHILQVRGCIAMQPQSVY